jgi:hypothetical protein
MRIFLLTIVAVILFAQQQLNPIERLKHARHVLAERNGRLPDYMCVQTVERRYLRPRHLNFPVPPCDQLRLLNPEGFILQSTDRLRLGLKVSDRHEIGSWDGSEFSSQSIFDLIGGGAYGTGTMGALYSDVLANAGASYSYVGDDKASGVTLCAYSYQIPRQFSHYQVKAGSNWTQVAIHGTFWLDSNTLDMKRLLVEAQDLPLETGECEATTTVNYQKVHVGTGEFLLPQRSSIRMLMLDVSVIEVVAVYSGCQEYHGEATLHYFDDALAGTKTETPEHRAAPLPPGLPFSVVLIEPIDTDTAAAGDIVRARIRKPVRDPDSKLVLVPTGAVVQGRIIQMQHSFRKPRQFTIAIQLENFKWSGISAPLYARVIPSMSKGIFLSPFGQSPLVAAFPFTTDKSRYRVPAGYESKWITVKRPEEEPASRGRRSELLRWNRSDPHAAIATERQPNRGRA